MIFLKFVQTIKHSIHHDRRPRKSTAFADAVWGANDKRAYRGGLLFAARIEGVIAFVASKRRVE